MDPRPSQQKAVVSLVLDHVASDFCLKICNLALEANLAHSFLRLSVVPWVLVLLSFLVSIPTFLPVFRGITFRDAPGSTCTWRSLTSPIYPERYSGRLWWRSPNNKSSRENVRSGSSAFIFYCMPRFSSWGTSFTCIWCTWGAWGAYLSASDRALTLSDVRWQPQQVIHGNSSWDISELC